LPTIRVLARTALNAFAITFRRPHHPCLDRHRDQVPGGVAVLGEQGQQLGQPGHPATDLSPKRIKRRPILGGLLNEYQRAA
jgi:hypothetical protein